MVELSSKFDDEGVEGVVSIGSGFTEPGSDLIV